MIIYYTLYISLVQTGIPQKEANPFTQDLAKVGCDPRYVGSSKGRILTLLDSNTAVCKQIITWCHRLV